MHSQTVEKFDFAI